MPRRYYTIFTDLIALAASVRGRFLKMEMQPNAASPTTIASLPTELVTQVLSYDDLTEQDKAAFGATCHRFRDIAHPMLYRKFDWVAPYQSTSVLEEWIGLLALLFEDFLKPLIDFLMKIFGPAKVEDKKRIAFTERASLVREMSVLGGYQYYKDVGLIMRCYEPRCEGESFVELFQPFENLVRVELDDCAALTWPGYLTVVANLLVTKTRLEHLMLRHRLGPRPEDRVKADLPPIMEILTNGIVTRLKSLSMIIGRRSDPSHMGYEQFAQLMEVLRGAVGEVTTFEVFAHNSKIAETDKILQDGSVKPWAMPKLKVAHLHLLSFPGWSPLASFEAGSLVGVRKLKVMFDVNSGDMAEVAKNLSVFEALEELEIWDPVFATDWEYVEEEMPPLCRRKFPVIKDALPRLKVLRWIMGQNYGIMTTTVDLDVEDIDPWKKVSVSWSHDPLPREEITENLPDRLKDVKQGYLETGSLIHPTAIDGYLI
ncbi:hypothetical protein TWF696_004931 [Orbilia brochopaga]|uniref:F-box domain-containing protein n=1 Tax=Orbilia brochopaga TaxID=3140254 RepID=A0AAV9V5R5_9PEZI